MKHTLLGIAVSVFVLGSGPRVFADHITEVLDSWNANMAGNNICGLAFDQTTGNVWVYQCFAADLQRYSSDGTFLSSVPRPGDPANDVDIDIAPEALTLGGTPIPAGTLLFIDGEFGVAEIYAVDKTTGTVLASLTTGFGANLVVGGVYHSSRNTFFLVSASDTVAEVDPITGAVLSTFPTLPSYNVSFGDIEVDPGTGNLYLVSSASTSMAEFTTGGTFVQLHPQPPLVSLLSGIGLDDATDEVWVANQFGDVWRLGSPLPPCAPACAKQNVECLNPGPEYDTRTAVGRVFTPGGGTCTGWIIAAPNLILTNRHCITTNGDFDGPIGDVTTMSIEFNYECEACVGGAVKPTTTFNVTALVLDSVALDFAILQTAGNPAADWGQLTLDSNPPVVGEGVYEHHHAGGEVKGYDTGVVTSGVGPDQCLTGTTEFGIDIIATQGASGAPIFRASDHCVVGICHCGPVCAAGWGVPMSEILPVALPAILAAGGTISLCAEAACPGTGDCCASNGSPGCDDADCCNLICGIDPFCCDTTWDSLCAEQAVMLCDCRCPWDCVDGDGIVGIVDFLGLLAQWEEVGTSCDFDGGGVGIVDFLKLLAHWGPCP